MIICMKNHVILSLVDEIYRALFGMDGSGYNLNNGVKGGLIHMLEWYKKEIAKMLDAIENEEYLKKLYIIISNHMKKED